MRTLALALAACCLFVGHARADDDDSAADEPIIVEGATVIPRNFYWSVGAGWLIPLTGPDGGPAVEAEVHPGGRFGRVGFTAYFHGLNNADGVDVGLVTVGLTYEAAASRPKLILNMHAEAGFSYGESYPVVGAGVKTQLWIKGPFAIALNSMGHFFVDGTDTRLQLGSVLLVVVGM
jgi:hypothetical protein